MTNICDHAIGFHRIRHLDFPVSSYFHVHGLRSFKMIIVYSRICKIIVFRFNSINFIAFQFFISVFSIFGSALIRLCYFVSFVSCAIIAIYAQCICFVDGPAFFRVHNACNAAWYCGARHIRWAGETVFMHQCMIDKSSYIGFVTFCINFLSLLGSRLLTSF